MSETVRAQLDNATMRDIWGAAARRTEVELEHILNSVVPEMAAWAGLGSGPRMLYRLPGSTASTYVFHFCFLTCLLHQRESTVGVLLVATVQ